MSQPTKKTSPKSVPFWGKHRHFKHFVIGLIVIVFVLAGLGTWSKLRVVLQQRKLAPFYNTSAIQATGPLGEVVRQEPLGITIQNGTGYRILYRSQKADGTPSISSGMVFIPNTPAPAGGRPVVAWAHGTIGMGDQCAPSRLANPVGGIQWVSEMLQKGWVVTATDYAGLGTPGTLEYLIGDSEAHDVLNSVRAARNISATQAGSRFVIWGHSQGGHSALFSASVATSYTPELQLLGTVASAPAAELPSLFEQQQKNAVSWVIGPEVAVAWPTVNPALNVKDILTGAAQRSYKTIANKCIQAAAIDGLVRTGFKQQFFSTNILSIPAWAAEMQKQSAPVLTPSQPLMVAESTTDNVVLPNTTALYIQKACNANSNLNSVWVSGVTHMDLSNVIAPNVIGWMADRFNNVPATNNCYQPSPVAPAVE